MSETALQQAKQLAVQLSRSERAQLAEWLKETLNDEPPVTGLTSTRRSLYGLCADLGPAPSEEDIEEACREMWAGFPREDIA